MISKNNSEQLFGVVKERNINIDYQGSESKTVTVNVDAENKIISAEVNVEGLLGTTNKKAYPGHLGSIAYNNALETKAELHESVDELKRKDVDILNRINEIKRDYADKTYVQQQIVASTTLSKQIVDDVDLDSNKIIIDGNSVSPTDGILYLVKQPSETGESNYKQYTTVQGILTLIGTTSVDLTNYATLEYVDDNIDIVESSIESIQENLVTNYATKSSIPDVSQFITEIPSDYTTEDEVIDYVTDKLFDYATKSYVQSELSKAGTFTKLIVDSVDTENNTYTKDGITSNTVQDVIYLVPYVENEETVHQQYTMIDDKLSYIGSTKVDLKGYATVDYVDGRVAATELKLNTNINNTKKNLEEMILNIKFIDGGNAPAPN